jgi:hypothetical protein
MRLKVPLDIRANQCSALFQVDAPRTGAGPLEGLYLLEVELDGQRRMLQIGLDPKRCATHYPI